MSKYRQRHVALHVAYIGTNYAGFAVQEACIDTIEQHLFAALEKTKLIADRRSFHYSRCGRTDKGSTN